MHKTEGHIDHFLSQPVNQSLNSFQAKLGLCQTNSTDSTNSNHSCKRLTASSDGDSSFFPKK